MSNPLTEALASLRSAVTDAERVLAERTEAGADLGERMALAGDAYAARLRMAEAERSVPGAAHTHRAESFAETLVGLFALDDEDQAGKPSTDKPDDGEHPLAGLFA